MSTTQHTGQLSVQKDTFFGTGMQGNEDSVQKDTLFGTGMQENEDSVQKDTLFGHRNAVV